MCLSNYIAELSRRTTHTKLMPLRCKRPVQNQDGFGLVAALFAVIILAMFGVLAARYLFTTAISSAEDYLWAQALYGAEAAAHRQILAHDGGGTGGFVTPLIIQNTTCTVTSDSWSGSGVPATITVRGRAGSDITRIISVSFIL